MNIKTTPSARPRHVLPLLEKVNPGFDQKYRGIPAGIGLALLLLVSGPALAAAVAPDLGAAWTYTALGLNAIPTVGTLTCTGSGINGNVGSTFNSITNTSCTITGSTDAPVTGTVVDDFATAYSALDTANPVCDGVIPTTSTTLPPGVYCSAAGTTLGAGVIFTLNGTANDVWVFKIGTGGGGALTGTGFQVVMAGTAQPCNVYWWTAEAATLTDSTFVGTILSGSSFTMTRGSYNGRAMATTDTTVTAVGSMTFAGCAAPSPSSITVNKNFSDNNPDPVSVALTCTSGTVTTTPLNAAEGAPAVFIVTGAGVGATCRATETVPPGYTANQANCAAVALNGNCTIINTLIAPPPPTAIPTISEWALITLTALLALIGFAAVRRQEI